MREVLAKLNELFEVAWLEAIWAMRSRGMDEAADDLESASWDITNSRLVVLKDLASSAPQAESDSRLRVVSH